MKTLRTLANIAILSSLAVPLAIAAFFVWLTRSQGASQTEAWGGTMGFAIVIYFIGIGCAIAFLIGLALHGFLAVRLQLPCRWAWWYCLSVSLIAMTAVRPIGTLIGAIIVFLMLRLGPFRIMRRGVEPCNAAYR